MTKEEELPSIPIVPEKPLEYMTKEEFAERAKRFLDEPEDIVILGSDPLNREGVETIDDLTEEEFKERARRFIFTAEDVDVPDEEEEEDAGN